MKFVFYLVICCILFTFSFSGRVFGQIYNVDADTVVVTDVPTDSIFVFYTHNIGTIKARYQGPGTATFQWSVFNASTAVYDSLPSYTDSVASNLASGGYQVHITEISTGYNKTFKAWVYIDTLTVKLEKDNFGNLYYYRYTCDYTDIKATSTHSSFVYYDSKGRKQTLPEPTYRWWTDPAIPIYPSDNTNWLRVDTSRMPLEKATFYVEAKDRFGHISNTDFVNYSPIITKAIIDTTGSYPVVEGENSAPFHVSFVNNSKNGVSYRWFLVGIDTIPKRKLPPFTTKKNFDTTFYSTGTFTVKLLSQSLDYCTDTAKMNIIVAKGKIGKDTMTMPNVFTPGEGSSNPYFKIHNVSIRQFRFTVYSRWGKPVYKAEGPDMLDWQGWKGNISQSGGDGGPEASDGVYYYVLEAISYDKVPDPKRMKPNGQYSGFLYLFRQK